MDLTALNPEQRRAAETLEGPVLILAGAGSGKTRALTYRVANLIDHGVPAWSILALTFTNKAAKEMKTRVEQLIGAEKAEEAWISTFHSTCARILRRDIERGMVKVCTNRTEALEKNKALLERFTSSFRNLYSQLLELEPEEVKQARYELLNHGDKATEQEVENNRRAKSAIIRGIRKRYGKDS